ncbi:PAS domain S-box protein [bacterium]|nr:PAS domain S-box protein [bacterium]
MISAGDGVLTTDSEGKITFMNLMAEKITGWMFAEAKGIHIDNILILEDEAAGGSL